MTKNILTLSVLSVFLFANAVNANQIISQFSIAKQMDLQVVVPENFVGVKPNEFILQSNEDVDSWSEKIVIDENKSKINYIKSIFTGKSEASLIVKSIIDDIKTKYKDFTLFEESELILGSKYASRSFKAEYKNQNHHEMIFVRYASGNLGCEGVTYIIRLNENMTREKAEQKINAFSRNSVYYHN